MNFLGKIISPVIQTEMMALHYTHNFLGFFAFLPLLDSETSGRKKNGFERTWDKIFKATENGFAKAQMGQMKFFGKLGLLSPAFIGRHAGDYMVYTQGDLAPDLRVDEIIRMNEKGLLTDPAAAKYLAGECNHAGVGVDYDEKSKQFIMIFSQTPQEEVAAEVARDKMAAWALSKAATVQNFSGKEQKDFAASITGILMDTAFADDENDDIAISPRTEHSLCVIFKKAVNKDGQPLAAVNYQADYLPQMALHMEERKEKKIAVFLKRRLKP